MGTETKETELPENPETFASAKILKIAQQMVVDKYNSIKRGRSEKEKNWGEWYKIYRLQGTGNTYKGRANMKTPKAFGAVETLAPRLALGLLRSYPNIQVKPIGLSVQDERVVMQGNKIKRLLEVQMEQIGIFARYLSFVKQMLIYGGGRAKVFYTKKYRVSRRKELVETPIFDDYGSVIDSQKSMEMITANRIEFSGPEFKTIDRYMLYEDPTGETVDDTPCVIERHIVNKAHLLDWKRRGYYKNLEGFEDSGSILSTLMNEHQLQRMATSGIDMASMEGPGNKFELLEYWGEFDLYGDGTEQECVITVLEQKRVIRCELNPWPHGRKPYLDCPYTLLPNEMDGMGVIEPVRFLQYEADDTHNQIMDNKTLILNCMWLVDKMAGINPRDLVMRQGGIIRTSDMKGLEALRPPDMTAAGYNAFSLLEALFKEATGATSALQGQNTIGKQTATEVSSLLTEGNVRLELVMELLTKRVFIPMLEMWHILNEEYYDQTIYEQITGPKGIKEEGVITPEDVYGQWQFLHVRDSENDAIKQNQLVQFFQLAAQFAPQVVPLLLGKIWAGFGFRGGEEVFAAINPAMVGPGMGEAMHNAGGPTNIADMLKNVMGNKGGR